MKILRIILSIVLIFCIVFTFSFGKISATDKLLDKKEEFKEILTIWQIDSFEGGKWSRREFINSVARKFEKNNTGVLIMVKTLSSEGVAEAVKRGEMPDIISYGAGVDMINLQELKINKCFLNGKINDKQYAIPWCRGGYLLFSNPQKSNDENIDKIVVSQAENTQPLLAMLYENINANKIEILPPLEAYIQFVTGKTAFFLGTQRDVERLESKGVTYTAKPLENYNDLYQYLSVTERGNKKESAIKFVEYLLSKEIQLELSKISMMSEFYTVNFQNQTLAEMSKIKAKYGLSAFLSKEQLKELQNLSLTGLKGDDESIIKIKNFVVKS